jgi:hypothetical protein
MQEQNPRFKDKFIGYVDILGWKSFVEQANAEVNDMNLQVLIRFLDKLGSQEKRRDFAIYGPTFAPDSKYIQRDLDFQLTQAYDCVVVSTEVSPAGVINLIGHCWSVVMGLLGQGIMCRGYITRGPIFHTSKYCIGIGHQKALEGEKDVSFFKREADKKGTPFVEIDESVCEYVEASGDSCVKTLFARKVKKDGKLTALFPTQALVHQFVIGGFSFGGFKQKCDLAKEKEANNQMRLMLTEIRERVKGFVDTSNPDAVRKSEHYIKVLDDQLRECDGLDSFIGQLGSPFPATRKG